MSAPTDRGEISVSSLTVDEAVAYAITDAAIGTDGQRIPIKQVAALANIPLSVVYDIASGRRPARANELAVLVRATRCTAPVDAVERDISRIGVALPVIPVNGDPALERAAKACLEFGQFMTEMGAAAGDRSYSAKEARGVRAEAEQTIAAILATVQQVEAAASAGGKGRVA